MSRFAPSLVLGVALVGLSAVGCGGKDAKPSSPAPCTSGALLHVALPATIATMSVPTFSICRNGTCYAWASAVPSPGGGGEPEYVTDQGPVLATLWRSTSGSITLDVEWQSVNSSLLQDGDHYVITLADGAGVPVVVLDKTAIYAPATSSGTDSGVSCLQAKLSA